MSENATIRGDQRIRNVLMTGSGGRIMGTDGGLNVRKHPVECNGVRTLEIQSIIVGSIFFVPLAELRPYVTVISASVVVSVGRAGEGLNAIRARVGLLASAVISNCQWVDYQIINRHTGHSDVF